MISSLFKWHLQDLSLNTHQKNSDVESKLNPFLNFWYCFFMTIFFIFQGLYLIAVKHSYSKAFKSGA